MHNSLKLFRLFFLLLPVVLSVYCAYGTPYKSTEQSFYKKSYVTVKVHKRKTRKKRKARKQSRFKVSYRNWHRHMKALLTDHVKIMDGLALDCEQLSDQLEAYHQVIANTGRFGNQFNKEEIAQNYMRTYESTPSWHSDGGLTTAYHLYKALWNNLLKMNSTYKSLQRLKRKQYRVRNFKKGRIKQASPYHFSVISGRDFFLKEYANYTLSYKTTQKAKYYSRTRYKEIKIRGLWNDFVRRVIYKISL